MNNLEKKCLWVFSKIPNIEESSFNKVLEKFYNLGIAGLTRENIQNSLDAKINDPVMITIKTGKINKVLIPGIDELKDRISCLQGCNSYTNETIEHIRNKMNENQVNYISFEDNNTKGLKGAKNGQSNSKEDTWGVYAYNKGVHSEEDDITLEKYRGGSHGIGKIASNAASDLNVMYFANCDEEGNKHIGGTIQLIEHKYKENYYRSTGYFTDVKNSNGTIKFYPFENKHNELFYKDTRGLKIIIPFLREQFNNEKEIIKSICDSFFIAIIQKRLEVIVNDKRIDRNTIKHYILNKEYYNQEIIEMKKEFTPLYFDTYNRKEPILIEIADCEDKYKFNLYFCYNKDIPKGRVAIIRTLGMKIEDKKIKGNANKPFNAVLIPYSYKEDAFLKSLENESHLELSFEHIKDQRLQRNAKRFINNISKEISKIIDDEIRKNNPTDGLMDTADVLYLVENQFKQELSTAMATVKLNKGNKDKTIIKIKSAIPNKVKHKVKSNRDKSEDKEEDKDKKKEKRIKRVNKKENDKKQVRYSTHPDIVERLILGNKEIVKFDFSDIKEFDKEKQCDISLSVVDGMGIEYDNEFNMRENYSNVIDMATGKQCMLEDNFIKDIEINNGVVQIELKLTKRFNKALKFVYYVEV